MIVVIGAGVAGLSAARALADGGHEVRVLEASPRVGGLVCSERTPEGLLLEHGPDSVMMTKPGARESLTALGLDRELVPASARRSFVLADAGLKPLPAGLLAMSPGVGWQMMRSPLFSLRAKARFTVEPLVPPRADDADESVGAFFTRRFGREVVDRLVDPLLGGIYGTEADRLSLAAVMPRLRDQERRHGSVARGMLRRSGRPDNGGGPPLATIGGGMQRLPDALAEGLRIDVDTLVLGLERRRDRFSLRLSNGRLDADAVVIATPVWHAAALLEGLDPDLAVQLGAMSATRVDAVTLAWDRADVPHALDGTGFVVPRSGRRSLAACTWSSEKWPDRAPDGTALLKAFIRDGADALPSELIDVARAELRDLLGVDAAPRFARVHRIRRALPRYEVGHPARVDAIERRAEALDGVALAGNAYRGIGLPDCMASGRAAAQRLTEVIHA